MQTRTLGPANLEVSALEFGCMGISFGYGRASSREDGIGIIGAASEIAVHGARYPEQLQRMVGR